MSSRVGGGSSRLGPGGPGAGGDEHAPVQEQGNAAGLVVMVAVLCFMLAYCCWGAPCCRGGADDCSATPSRASTPNILLLPHGRILLLDQVVVNAFHQELGLHHELPLPRLPPTHQIRYDDAPNARRALLQYRDTSIETDSDKDSELSPSNQGIPPPTYDSLFTRTESSSSQSFPPPYEEITRLNIDVDKNSVAESSV
ncbi:unnamed protein product [Bemisia tabaci]|uniref:Uncharacterized protein n=1 Tax=Bemisia tabaci TaxID=7038 RepID=A0A9P0A449_BEMTA|nr:unnamed protein product [Bemisia tabaci]